MGIIREWGVDIAFLSPDQLLELQTHLCTYIDDEEDAWFMVQTIDIACENYAYEDEQKNIPPTDYSELIAAIKVVLDSLHTVKHWRHDSVPDEMELLKYLCDIQRRQERYISYDGRTQRVKDHRAQLIRDIWYAHPQGTAKKREESPAEKTVAMVLGFVERIPPDNVHWPVIKALQDGNAQNQEG